jgi:hypothetical protein
MSATLAAPPLHRRATEPSLESLVTGAWDAVATGEPAECPVCAGPMQPRWSAGAGVVGGRCEDCGTTLE